MTNFIFKSQGTFKTICNKLEIIQSELRHQRADNVQILFLLNKLVVDERLQKQVDDYFDETSPQTELEEHGNSDDNS